VGGVISEAFLPHKKKQGDAKAKAASKRPSLRPLHPYFFFPKKSFLLFTLLTVSHTIVSLQVLFEAAFEAFASKNLSYHLRPPQRGGLKILLFEAASKRPPQKKFFYYFRPPQRGGLKEHL